MSDEHPLGPNPDSPPAGVRPLLRRIGRAVMHNKGLVAAILALGIAEAALTKAPLALLKPLSDALAPAQQGVAATPDAFMQWFEEFAYWLRSLHGFPADAPPPEGFIGPVAPDPGQRAMTLCTACAILTVVLGLLGAAVMYGTLLLTHYFAAKIVVDLRNEVAAHILELPLRFFGIRRMGDLLSNITTDTTVLSRSFTLACDHVVVDPLLILANVGLIVVFAPQALWVLVLLVPVMALPMIRMGRRVQRTSRRSLAAMGDATESMNQMLSGIRTVKAFQLERERLRDFEDSNALYLRRTRRMLRVKAMSQSLIYASYMAGLAVLLVGAGWLILSEDYQFSNLAVPIAALGTTYTHVKRMTRAYNTVMESVGAMDRIESLLGERPDQASGTRGIALDTVRGDVAFENVRFSYGRERVLHGISFHARPGETVALVGPSGAGKSTALDLLARFHDPESGRVLIDGHDLRSLDLASYRRHLAIVSQQPFLFNTTIRENIRCGRPDATDQEVVQAARQAQIHDFIASLPQGYESMAGERGCNLSGGQMQRITIARAILRDPAILILDEATAALDSKSEEAVQAALQNLRRGRTAFVIAHRLSTVRSADQILVLERGHVIESGTHEQLVDANGLYARLSRLQQLDPLRYREAIDTTSNDQDGETPARAV